MDLDTTYLQREFSPVLRRPELEELKGFKGGATLRGTTGTDDFWADALYELRIKYPEVSVWKISGRAVINPSIGGSVSLLMEPDEWTTFVRGCGTDHLIADTREEAENE